MILTGRAQNNFLNLKSLKLIKIYLITEVKMNLKKDLLKEIKILSKKLKKGLNSFDEDIKHWNDYDYILINEKFRELF